jgi:hypothetical protein
MWPLMNRPTLVALASVSFFLASCLHGPPPCVSADWVDRVEDHWLVVVDDGGSSRTYPRSPGREDWTEGDALVNGQVRPECRIAMRSEIHELRRALSP